MKKYFLLTLLIFISCKETKKTEEKVNLEKPQEVVQKNEPVFIFKIDLVLPEDDEIELFYTDYYNEKYSWKTRVRKKVKGNTSQQTITFKLPEEVFPSSLRIDFGKNKLMSDIILNKITMSYEDFSFDIPASDFSSFFIANKYASYNKEKGIISTMELEGKYDPYFESKPVFKQKLKIEER